MSAESLVVRLSLRLRHLRVSNTRPVRNARTWYIVHLKANRGHTLLSAGRALAMQQTKMSGESTLKKALTVKA